MSYYEKIGMISGAGEFPLIIAQRISQLFPSTKIFTVALTENADPRINKLSVKLEYISPGEISRIIEYFTGNGVTKAVMAGLVRHKKLFDSNVKLDPLMLSIFGKIKDNRADSILSAIAEEFQSHGVEILPLTGFLGDNLAGDGILTQLRPDENQQKDIAFGVTLAGELSRFDIGQAIVVKNRCVVAVEALEGTDLCILRSGKLAGPDCVVIKIAKFSQDLRFDLPVVGMNTLKNMLEVSARILVVEAGKTCLINKDELLTFANENKMCIIGIKVV